MKTVKERDNLDLLELTLQLHSRALNFPSEEMHNAYIEARRELEKRFHSPRSAQLCPKCKGQGTVSKPPHVPGDIDHWSSSDAVHTCDVCKGAKLLYPPSPEIIPSPKLEEMLDKKYPISKKQDLSPGESYLNAVNIRFRNACTEFFIAGQQSISSHTVSDGEIKRMIEYALFIKQCEIDFPDKHRKRTKEEIVSEVIETAKQFQPAAQQQEVKPNGCYCHTDLVCAIHNSSISNQS